MTGWVQIVLRRASRRDAAFEVALIGGVNEDERLVPNSMTFVTL
jgi:hypothetical protein